MNIHPFYVGCDISKHFLDFFDPSQGKAFRITNTAPEVAQLASALAGRGALVVMEASGAYDRRLRAALSDAGVAYVRVNPTRARRFAQVAGFLAKTDALDARMLSALGATMNLTADAPADPAREALAALHKRRDQLVQVRADEKKRHYDAQNDIATSIDRHIDWLNDEIAMIEKDIAALIKQSDAMAKDAALMRSAPGIGAVAATSLLALMPELGRVGPKQIAALAGLAPINHDSGAMRGARRIKGGRRRIRQAIYMAALSAIRSCQRYRDFYEAIVSRSGAKKVAIIAVARKLLTHLNAMIRDQKLWA